MTDLNREKLDHLAFHNAIAAEHKWGKMRSLTPALVYADKLEEGGFSALADHIRSSVKDGTVRAVPQGRMQPLPLHGEEAPYGLMVSSSGSSKDSSIYLRCGDPKRNTVTHFIK